MVFPIEFFQAPGLIDFHSAVFTALTVVGLLADAEMAGSLTDGLALGDEDLRLPEVTDDMVCGITLLGYNDPFLVIIF